MKITRKQKTKGVGFDDIEPGDCFIWKKNLYMKIASDCREALLLSSGDSDGFDRDNHNADDDDVTGQIFPVNAEITYEENE